MKQQDLNNKNFKFLRTILLPSTEMYFTFDSKNIPEHDGLYVPDGSYISLNYCHHCNGHHNNQLDNGGLLQLFVDH